MPRSVVLILLCCIFACGAATHNSAIAQSTAGNGLGSFGDPGAGTPGTGGAGGAAMADFDTLMNLIQQTIDPDDWLANGGTNTITPYPSGVYIDPKGTIQRVQNVESNLDFLRNGSKPQASWRRESEVRTISLRALDTALQNAARLGLSASAEMQKLAGLKHIRHVQIDLDNEDILLAGPAGSSVHGFDLIDLAVVLTKVNQQTTAMGCSLEPNVQGIMAAQDMLNKPGMVKRLARSPASVADMISEKVGPHAVVVFGLPKRSTTALALLDADEHLKRVAFEKASLRTPIDSYFDHLDRLSKVPDQSIVRFWFAFSDEPTQVSKDGTLFRLPQPCVQVLSEQQWVSQQGRAPTGNADIAAEKFAADFSKRMPELREQYEAYARLNAVFETSLALQHVVNKTGQPSLAAWFPNIYGYGSVEQDVADPKQVDGLTAWNRLKSGTVVAAISGGVKIDLLAAASEDKLTESKFVSGSAIGEQPEETSLAQQSWWWD